MLFIHTESMHDINLFRSLIKEVQSTGLNLLRLQASGDPEKETLVASLPSFNACKQQIIDLENFNLRIGSENSERVVHQFISQYHRRLETILYDDITISALWADLIEEINNPNWVTRCIANLRYFRSDTLDIDLGDGVKILQRIPLLIASLGFDKRLFDRIQDDWGSFGSTPFVLVAEDIVPKTPSNVLSGISTDLWFKPMRAIGACRLAARGSITLGAIWCQKITKFDFGIGGYAQLGASVQSLGQDYIWSEDIASDYPLIYRNLAYLEANRYKKSPGNLGIALRAFMSIFDRFPTDQGAQILDAVTSLDALLGTTSENTFRLSLRVASLLANNDEERSKIFRQMRDYYSARSKLIHGEELKQKELNSLQQLDQLIDYVRKLLRVFVDFSSNHPDEFDRNSFLNALDEILVNSIEREKLRSRLKLC